MNHELFTEFAHKAIIHTMIVQRAKQRVGHTGHTFGTYGSIVGSLPPT